MRALGTEARETLSMGTEEWKCELHNAHIFFCFPTVIVMMRRMLDGFCMIKFNEDTKGFN